MWWDERLANFEGDVIPSGDAARSAKTPPLTASLLLESAYVRELVKAAFDRRPEWQVTVQQAESHYDIHGEDFLFFWGEYEGIDWEKVHAGDQHACCYCFRKGLIRKAHLCHNTKKWAAKHPGGWLAKSVPEAFIFELDDIDYIEEALCDVPEVRDMPDGSARWIAKPSITNQATGICIFDRVSQLEAALHANEDLREWVLQRYIEKPLLIKHRKFHIRAYVLCVGSLKAYVYSQALALFAGEQYDSKLQNLGNLNAHLTNTCRLEDVVEEEQAVRLLSELPQLLQQEGLSAVEAKQGVHQVVQDMHAIIEQDEEEQGDVQANAEPDLQQTGGRLKPVVAGLIEGIMQLVVDPLALSQGCRVSEPLHKDSSDMLGQWLQVLDKKQGRHLGGSGMAFQ